MSEATAVAPEGRISPWDTGIWNDEQASAWSRIVDFVHQQGAVAGMQLAHAGRKASSGRPWQGRGPVADADGGWEPVAPSAASFDGLRDPRALSADELSAVVDAFVDAARRALRAGFDLVEVHAAHGYLLHQFLSPLSNRRDDRYGGSFENRVRLLVEVVEALRADLPAGTPLLVRLSATDWAEGGWTVDESVRLARLLHQSGVDLVDVSSGGTATGAVGLITDAKQAEDVVADGSADAVLLARAMLRNPHWPLEAAHQLGVRPGEGVDWPEQYLRASLD
jgi:2,4-dienoyl-CoA reductase-like NADH-dependent reductase (Old Yellow Enzyme family)